MLIVRWMLREEGARGSENQGCDPGLSARAVPQAGSGWLQPTRGGFPYIDTPTRGGATRHQESATDAGPVSAQRAPSPSCRPYAPGPGPSADLGGQPRAPRLAGAPRARSRAPAPRSPRPQGPHLQQRFDPLDGRDSSLGDGSGHAAGQKSFRKLRAWSLMVTAGRTPPPRGPLSLSPPGQPRLPLLQTLRDAKGPLTSPRCPLYIPPKLSREEAGPQSPARPSHWLGGCSEPRLPDPPLFCGGNGGEGASGRQGWARGCACTWDV